MSPCRMHGAGELSQVALLYLQGGLAVTLQKLTVHLTTIIFGAAIALVLVITGLLPVLAPLPQIRTLLWPVWTRMVMD